MAADLDRFAPQWPGILIFEFVGFFFFVIATSFKKHLNPLCIHKRSVRKFLVKNNFEVCHTLLQNSFVNIFFSLGHTVDATV